MMAQDDIAAALREIAGDLESGDAPLRRDIEARILRRVCKRMAIKAGRVLALSEMQVLVRDLEACASPDLPARPADDARIWRRAAREAVWKIGVETKLPEGVGLSPRFARGG